jgi:polyphenol oxidase
MASAGDKGEALMETNHPDGRNGRGLRFAMRRRDFVAGSLTVGAAWMTRADAWAQIVPIHCVPPQPPGIAVPFVPPNVGPVRVRKSAFELDQNEIARLKAAYAALRNVYRDDPRSWYQQGLVHCWYCSGAINGLNGMEIHGGWWFLPWHRAYLYFHEQTLASLIGDPSFALPYWDWDTSGRDRFPEVYMDPADATNPLFDPTRRVGPSDRIPAAFVGPSVIQNVMSAASFSDFGGSSDQGAVDSAGNPAQMGQLEGAPHGGVHVWVTDPTAFGGASNMGALATAAFDPVFFAHHANIDRLWDVWAKGAGHTNPNIARWLEQPFYFYDQTQTWTFMEIGQTIDPESMLRFRYQQPTSTDASVAAASADATAAESAAPQLGPLAPLSAPLVELARTAEAKSLTPEPSTVELAVPQDRREAVMEMAAPASANRLILRIDGVEVPADRAVAVKVFVNRPDATAATGPDEPGFVGTIVLVPSVAPGTGLSHGTVRRNFAFDITEELASALDANDNISVTFVPFAGEGQQPADIDLRYERVYVAAR